MALDDGERPLEVHIRAAAGRKCFRAGRLTGVRSRRDLVGKVVFSHYEPRGCDNERRVIDNRPLRGGPHMQLLPGQD